MGIRVFPYGQTALMVATEGDMTESSVARVHALSSKLSIQFPNIHWRCGYTCILGDFSHTDVPVDTWCALVERALRDFEGSTLSVDAPNRSIEVPVCYGGEFGPDLEEVAHAHGITPDEVIRIHSHPVYKVAFLGFLPGFPYLMGLPQTLATPRLREPRIRVPSGSVGIGGSQTGVYPKESPGGWRLIGRTPLPLFSIHQNPPTLFQAGDSVRFRPILSDEFKTLFMPVIQRRVEPTDFMPVIEVLKTGLLATIQDAGRQGYEHVGVGRAGWMDNFSPRVANLLVGNDERDPVIECSGPGLVLKFHQRVVICISGADFFPTVDGRPVPMWQSLWMDTGSVLSLRGYRSGAKAYISIAGGVRTPLVLGSYATDVGQGFGGLAGRPLQKADLLTVHVKKTPHDSFVGRSLAHHVRPLLLNDIQLLFTSTVAPSSSGVHVTLQLQSATWTVSPKSNRMGVRFTSDTPLVLEERQVVSEPVVPGTIQIPPNGLPIVLTAEAQTTGGYQTAGVLSRASLDKLAQVGPGGTVRFVESNLASVVHETEQQRRILQTLRIHNR